MTQTKDKKLTRSQQRRLAVIDDLNAGLGVVATAVKHERSVNYVQSIKHALDFAPATHAEKAAKRAHVVKLLREGRTFAEVECSSGLSSAYVRQIARNAGIPIPAPARAEGNTYRAIALLCRDAETTYTAIAAICGSSPKWVATVYARCLHEGVPVKDRGAPAPTTNMVKRTAEGEQ